MGPIFHWKDKRIRAHVMICFFALILRTILYKKIRAEDEKISYSEVLSDIGALHAIGLRVKNQSVVIRTELKPGAALAFRALKMNAPKRILQSETLTKTQVVVPRLH